MPYGNLGDLRSVLDVNDAQQLGVRRTHKCTDYSTTPFQFYSAEPVEAIWVQNKSGGTLAKGIRVGWNNGADTLGPGRSVGAAVGDETRAAGVVSPWIKDTTVAANKGFWLIVKGPTKVGYDGSATIAIGSPLGGAATGWTKLHVEVTDPELSFMGYALEAITSGAAGTLFWARVNFDKN